MRKEGIVFKKVLVSMGLILLVIGVIIFLFPKQEPYFELKPVTIDEWNLQQRTLAPQNTTSYARLMKPGMLFRLNISCANASNSVKVTVSFVKRLMSPIKVPIFEQTGNIFNQEVPISGTGTYFVDVTNENPNPVTLLGNVLIQQKRINYYTIYPYVIPGFLIMLTGTIVLIIGISKRPKRAPKSRMVKS